MLKTTGSGTTNDGNSACKFFLNPAKTSINSGIDKFLIKRISIILCVVSSASEIKTEDFSTFCLLTAKKYVKLYAWYYMPQSLYKILVHGAAVIESLDIPIGQLCEETQEARNKEFRKYRKDFTRKCSWTRLNEGTMSSLLIWYDPLINNLKKMRANHIRKEMTDDAVNLLKNYPEAEGERDYNYT